MFPRMILYCVVLLIVTKVSFAAPHKYNCTDPSASATDHIQHFACTTNKTYNFLFKSNGTGLYLDMKVTMFLGDTFTLSSGTGNKSRNITSLKGEQHSYAVTYFIPDESVVISTTLNESMKGLRTFSGMFHEGCNATVSSSTPVFHFPAYVSGSEVVVCYITIHASNAKENYAYASLDSVNLKGKSSLSITGKPAVFPAELKAGDAPAFDFIATELQFALALDLSIANQSFTILLDSVYNNCSGMTEMPSVAAQTLLLPTANMSDYLLQRLNCRWIIRGPQNNVLGLEILGFSLAGTQDLLVITDGGRRDSPVVLQASPCDARQVTDLVYSTSSRYMWISLTISEYNTSDTFAARASVSAEGGHFYDGATNVHITEASKESVYLLEVKPEKQVLLSVKASLKSSASVEVVSDFYKNGAVLQKFSAGTEPYPVASLNNRLMLRAKGFTKEDTFTFNFTGVEPGCHSTTLGTRGFYSLSNTCSAFCTWAINPSNSSEYKEKFTLTLNHLDLDKDDTVSISSLSQPHKPVLLLNASFSALEPVEMSSIDGAYVIITRNKCVQANRTVASGSLSGVIGSSFAPKLMPGVAYSFKSPMFPNQYPLNSTRSWTFNGTGIRGYHLTFSSMDIAKNHTLNLRSGNQSVPLTGSVLPADIVLENSILHAEFAAPVHQGYATGYGFDALLMPLDMVQVIVKESGQVETPSFPALINNSNTIFWSIYVPNVEPKKMSVAILFNVSHHKSAKAPGTLTIYDGNSVRSPVLGNVTGENLLSRSDTILVKLVTVGGNESGSALQLNFTTYRCNMSDTCNNSKICIHEDWRCNGVNDCGDNSDEVDCGYHPTPSPSPTTPPPGPPSPSKGVSVAAFVVTVLLALVIGAVGALFVPVLVRRYRAYRYSRFSNVAVSE
ncbi:cubilin [Rhipicephalus microplus]|uniref:cubilin n=1 Tax=Rhipicephalus microplus TaxID=6941 RepID=UPI003F6C10FA